MKLKKLISSGLALGLLFNSTSVSLASILSEDGRYETFEGSSITIDDIQEEDKVDIEIEGNTLVNLVGNIGCAGSDFNAKTFTSSNNSHTLHSATGSSVFFINSIYNLKGKTVTLCFDYEIVSNINANMLHVGYYNGSIYKPISGYNYYVSNGHHKVKLVLPEDYKALYVGYIHILNEESTQKISNVMILEGDWTNKEIPDYFEGMKSVGELENNSLKIESIGENLFDVEYFKNMIETHYDEGNYGYEVKDGRNTVWTVNNHNKLNQKNILNNNYVFKPNTQYIIKSETFLDPNHPTAYGALVAVIYYKDDTFEFAFHPNNSGGIWSEYNYITKKNNTVDKIVFSYGQTLAKSYFNLDSLYIGEYNPEKTEFNYDYNVQNIEIDLNEPLRGLPNGVKDRIVKKNGQWVIERNTREISVDTSTARMYNTQLWDDYYGVYIDINEGLNMKIERISGGSSYYSDFIVYPCYWSISADYYTNSQNMYGVSANHDEIMRFFFKIPKTSVDIYEGTDDEKVKQWFKDNCNELQIYYQLETPIYESLNLNLSINLYEDITYISNNSTIPANIKVTVDRTINRAVEAIELAKANPTVENLSKARMWVNLLKETINKDKLQSQINDIIKVEDLQIEKKTVTSNMDLYIKPLNSLSISLSTNQILFEDYSSVSDLDMDNALQISVSSSLPYDLNSYLETEIQNSDGSSKIDKDLLHIKDDTENEYKQFLGINQKLILKEDCIPGSNNIHNIDLRLKASAHDADVYRTTIKFEAEQK